MGGLFGKKHTEEPKKKQIGKGGEITDVDRAKFQLKAASKKLNVYRKKLEKEIATNRERAKKCMREKKKDKAIFFLKINKFKTKRIRNLEGQLLNLETLVDNLKNEEDNAAVFKAMKAGNDQLKTMQKELPVEEVQKLMDDSADARQYLDEVGAILGEDLADVDEAEVLKEYDALLELDADETMATLPVVPKDDTKTDVVLPDVPTDEPTLATKTAEKKEEKRVAVLA
eukprot:g3093.t1